METEEKKFNKLEKTSLDKIEKGAFLIFKNFIGDVISGFYLNNVSNILVKLSHENPKNKKSIYVCPFPSLSLGRKEEQTYDLEVFSQGRDVLYKEVKV